MPPPPVRQQPLTRFSPRGGGAERDTFVQKDLGNSMATRACPTGTSLKEELNEAMRAQLREKDEKEELYRLRIEHLQQQIDLYRHMSQIRNPNPAAHLSMTSRPAPAADKAFARPCAGEISRGRSRSASPGPEPQTVEAASPISSRHGPCTDRSMSARSREVRNGASLEIPMSPTVQAARQRTRTSVIAGQVSSERTMPSLLTSAAVVRPMRQLKASAVRYVMATAGQEPRASGRTVFMANNMVSAAQLQITRPGPSHMPRQLANQATRGRSVGHEPRSLSPVARTHQSPDTPELNAS